MIQWYGSIDNSSVKYSIMTNNLNKIERFSKSCERVVDNRKHNAEALPPKTELASAKALNCQICARHESLRSR